MSAPAQTAPPAAPALSSGTIGVAAVSIPALLLIAITGIAVVGVTISRCRKVAPATGTQSLGRTRSGAAAAASAAEEGRVPTHGDYAGVMPAFVVVQPDGMGMACAYEIDKGDGGKTDSALGRPDSSDYKIGDAPSADNDSPDAPANATCGGAQQGAARECTSGNSFELKPA